MRQEVLNKRIEVHFLRICGLVHLFFLIMVFNAYALSLARTEARTGGGPTGFQESFSFASSLSSYPPNGNYAYAEADAANGVLRNSLTAWYVGSYASSLVYDEFIFSGLPVGTPVDLTAYLVVRGSLYSAPAWWCCPYVEVFASIYPSAEPPAYSYWGVTWVSGYDPLSVRVWAGNSETVDTVLSANLSITSGTPFGLVYGLTLGSNTNLIATADFLDTASVSFGLPDGTWITSDGGFYQSASAPIPEPTTFFLIGSGLVGIAGLRKKVKTKG